MIFNKECVRDIILICEEKLIMNDNGEMKTIMSEELHSCLPNYALSEIKYTVKKMEEADLLEAAIISCDDCEVADFIISDITVYGHEFIDNIRDESNWDTVKNIAKRVGAASLDVLSEISKQVISQAIMNNIGL